MRSIHFKAMVAGLALIGLAAGINNGRAQIIPEAFQLITFTNTWHYNPSGTDLHAMIPLGTDWRTPAYIEDPSLGWDSGGMGPNNGLPLFGFETTPLEYAYVFNTHFASPLDANGVPIQPYIITYYYRHHFNLPTNNLANLTLVLTNYIDDGVVYWLNGTELARLRIPTNFTGPNLVYTNLALNQGAEGVAEIVTVPFNVLSNLVAGDNTIAAEIHQTSKTSSDDVFGMSLSALLEQPIVITNQPQSQMVVAGKSFTLKVGGTGSFPFYSWYHVATNRSSTNLLVSGTTNFFYTLASALSTSEGSYFVTITNRFGKVTSSEAVLTVIPDTFGPLLVSATVIATDTNSRSIAVNFDERVNQNSVTNLSNYTVTRLGTTNQLLITNAVPLINGVRLSLASSLSSSNDYILTVNNVRDGTLNNNIVAPNSWIGISFVAISNIFSMNQTWRLDESEFSDLDPSWKSSLTYNDNPTNNFNWAEAPGVFAVSQTGTFRPCQPVGFTLGLNGITFYFRTKFNLSTNFGPNPSVRFTYIIDDGAVFYLNGTEVFRKNLPAGSIVYNTLAIPAVTDATCATVSTNIGPGILVKGVNLLAVELHYSNQAQDSDMALGVALDMSVPITPTVPVDPPNALHILRPDPNDPNTVNLWWGNTHGVALEAANSPTGPRWIQVPNMATNMLISVTNAMPVLGSSSTRFYRLHKVGF